MARKSKILNNIEKNLEIFDTADGKIVIEDGINFIKQLRIEAERQKIISVVEKNNIVQFPVLVSPTEDTEYNKIADAFEITEDDD